MKRKLYRLGAALLIFLLLPIFCLAEDVTEEEQGKDNSGIAVLLPANDGFQSLSSDRGISIQDILDVYIEAVEAKGNRILLQGATTNSNPSRLRYKTGDSQPINWNTIPTKGNSDTLHSTISGLAQKNYTEYDRIVLISGQLGNKIADRKLNKPDLSVPTYLFQTVAFDDGATLLSHYATDAGMTLPEHSKQDPYGADVYTVVDSEKNTTTDIHFLSCEEDSAVQLLERLLAETLFDGSVSVKPEGFRVPASLTKELYLLIVGESLEDIRLKSPDGTGYAVNIDNGTQINGLKSKIFPFCGQQARLISLKEIMSGGIWTIDTAGKIDAARMYYDWKQDAKELIGKAQVVDSQIDHTQLSKGIISFETISGTIIDDLFALYPDLRLRITDTVDGETKKEETASKTKPNHVDFHLSSGGDNTLTIRLVNGEEEILSQKINVTVNDTPLVFDRPEGTEIIVYPDTLEGNEWSQPVTGWFRDDDGDKITVSIIGDEDGRVSLENNILKLKLDENIPDGNETVRLKAEADRAEIITTVNVIWKNLKAQIDAVGLNVEIQPVNEGDAFGKRTKVFATAYLNYNGSDMARILEEMNLCEAMLTDENGAFVANIRFDEGKKAFISEAFELPDKAGQYRWKIKLNQGANRLPGWETDKRTETIVIENQAPVTNPEAIDESIPGDHYAFDVADWTFRLPEDLITDPDGDPVKYTVSFEGSIEAEPVVFDNYEAVKPICLPGFGEYTVVINGADNENVPADKMSFQVNLIDLAETLQSKTKGNIFTEPEQPDQTTDKRTKVKLILEMQTDAWSERMKEAVTTWLRECRAEVVMAKDAEQVSVAEAEYDEKHQIFTAEIETPDKGTAYEYRFLLENGSKDHSDIQVYPAEPYVMTVTNAEPQITENASESISSWILKAEDYEGFVVNDDYFQDADGDPIKYKMKITRKNDPDAEKTEAQEISDFPYTATFEPFRFFELSREYEAVITATDDDAEPQTHVVRVVLKNLQLLYIIIGAIILLLLIIAAVILYAIHRKNLPSFKGTLCFTYREEKVSPDIPLNTWRKKKHVSLMLFAGSIGILLSNEQWANMKQLEVRPDKTNGFNLYQVKAKASQPEEMPYNLGEGLSIKKGI